MTEEVKQQPQAQVPQHPYQTTQEKPFVCQPGDTECVNRLVQAYSDCD